jgi:hypothetical protein
MLVCECSSVLSNIPVNGKCCSLWDAGWADSESFSPEVCSSQVPTCLAICCRLGPGESRKEIQERNPGGQSRKVIQEGSHKGSWMSLPRSGPPLPTRRPNRKKPYPSLAPNASGFDIKHGRVDRHRCRRDRAQQEFGWLNKLNSTHSSCQTRLHPAKVRFGPGFLWYRFQPIFAGV